MYAMGLSRELAPVEESSEPQQYFPDNTGAGKQAEKACNAANKAADLEDRADNYRRRRKYDKYSELIEEELGGVGKVLQPH
jgi:hypothetical protein